MPDIDDRLQKYLSQIEAGVPKDQVLSALNEGEQELAALIKLADAMRTISHPMPAPAYSNLSKQKILATMPKSQPKRASNGKFQLGWLLFPSLTGAVALLVVMLITFTSLGIWLAGPANADIALAAEIDGVVEFASSPTSTDWTVLTGGESLRSGQYIRTSPGSNFVLLYSDGSRTQVGPETELLLRKIDGSWSGDVHIKLEQTLGQTHHDVLPLHSQDAYYTVVTPSGEANVHGTTFTVNVESSGTSRIIVDAGEVLVTSAVDEMLVPAGQATLLQPGTAQEMGNYFQMVGIIDSIQGIQWTVSGQAFKITNQTVILGTPAEGQVMKIEGRILGNGQWVADSITPVQEEFHAAFTGQVQKIADAAWVIGGKSVLVNETTQVGQGINVGSMVEVNYFNLSNGSWLALQITGLERTTSAENGETESGEAAPAEPTSTTASPTAASENRALTCQQDQTQSEAQRLAEQFNVSYEEIMIWYCSGYGFGEIELAYSLSEMFNQPVYLIFNLNNSMTWSEINAYLTEYQLANQPSSETCTSVINMPRAQQLSDKYGVTVDEIIKLLCQGNSYSTVDLTYSLAQEYNLTPAQILEMKAKGLNWGQLKKELRDKETGKPVKEDNSNKPDKNKNNNSNKDKKDNPNKP